MWRGGCEGPAGEAGGRYSVVRFQRSHSISSLGRVQGGGGRCWPSAALPSRRARSGAAFRPGDQIAHRNTPGPGVLGLFWDGGGGMWPLGRAAGGLGGHVGGGEQTEQVLSALKKGGDPALRCVCVFKRHLCVALCVLWDQGSFSCHPALISVLGGSPWG